MIMPQDLLQRTVDYVQAIAHEEACGVLVGDQFYPTKNVSKTPRAAFRMDPKELAVLEKKHGAVTGVVHSHVNGMSCPSVRDMEVQIRMGVPWHVHVLRSGRYLESFHWGDHRLNDPLISRKWRPGVYDCLSLFRSYYFQKFGMVLPDLARTDGWWDDEDTRSLFATNISRYPQFKRIDPQEAKKHDALIFSIRSEQPNHFAVMDTDQTMLHHPALGLSARRPCGLLQHTLWRAYRPVGETV